MLFWHFGLFEQPFGATPDARFLYPSLSHREALAAISRGIESGVSFLSLIGEPGLGKTTLLYALREQYAPENRIAYIASSECDPHEFVRNILESFELPVGEMNVDAMCRTFRDMIVSATSSGKRVILLVDDADALNTSDLDTLRLLSDLELPDPRLLNVVLAGQPQLNDALVQPELRSLQQRIITSARLRPLTVGESVQYIKHRLRTAGAGETSIFSPDAIALIAQRGRGNPREMNRICLNAMNLACALRRKQVEEDNVREILQDPESQPEPDAKPSPGPFLVSDATPASAMAASQSVTSQTWGSQALDVAPALENEPEAVAVAALHEAEPERAPSVAPPPPPPIDIGDAIRALRFDLLDESPVPGNTRSTFRISRSMRRVILISACVAGLLVCVTGIVLLSRMAWRSITDHRAATQAEADSTATPASTPETASTKKSSRAHAGKQEQSSLRGIQGSSADRALVGKSSAEAQSAPNSSQRQGSNRTPGWPRNLDQFRIPGMIIIPVPFQRSPYAPPVVPAALQFRVEPIYPLDAKAQHLEGTVKIRLHIDRAGHVQTMLVLSGDRRLAKPALAAVRQWVFSPFQESGAPFEGDTTVSLQFMADSSSEALKRAQ